MNFELGACKSIIYPETTEKYSFLDIFRTEHITGFSILHVFLGLCMGICSFADMIMLSKPE